MKWAVELLGEDFDVQDARTLFTSGTARIETIEGNATVLVADDFESLTDSHQVREVAKNLIDLINGVLFLHDAARSPVQIGAVRENRDGNWSQYRHLGAETIPLRLRLPSPTLVLNEVAAPPKPPPERKWFQDAISDDVAADVVTYLRAKPDWFELYKAFERMRDDINRKLGGQQLEQMMGWPNKDDLSFFSRSANVHRHSPTKWEELQLNPTTAMKIDDARSFIRRLAQIWLSWRT